MPGEKIADSPLNGVGIYTYENKTFAKQFGVLYLNEDSAKVVPLKGKYMPKEGDRIIGVVASEDAYGYVLDIMSFVNPYVSKRAIKTKLKVGDLVLCQVYSVNEVKELSLDILAKLEDGILLEISSKKVPRVIGKHKSMISLLEKYSGSRVLVGANGYIFAQGGKVDILRDALNMISEYSHVDNLTEKIDVYLKKMK